MNTPIPPHDLTAELAVIGSVCPNPEQIPSLIDLLCPEDFFRAVHARIWRAIVELHTGGEPVDELTVLDRVQIMDDRDGKDVAGTLFEALESAVVPAHVLYHARTVRNLSVKRKLAVGADKIRDLALNGASADDAFGEASRIMDDLRRDTVRTKSAEGMGSLVGKVFDRIDDVATGNVLPGLDTGIAALDDQWKGGLVGGEMVVLGARPGVGKSVLGLTIASNVGENEPVYLFSLEMKKEEIGFRLLSAESRVSGTTLKQGLLTDAEQSRVIAAGKRMAERKLTIDDDPHVTVSELIGRIGREAGEGTRLFVIDYLQLVRPGGKFENRREFVSELSRSIKTTALRLDVTILAICQLNRDSESRGGKPRLSDLRESGSIEQDADRVWFLHEQDNDLVFTCAKNRNGPTGEVRLDFQKAYSRIEGGGGSRPIAAIANQPAPF